MLKRYLKIIKNGNKYLKVNLYNLDKHIINNL